MPPGVHAEEAGEDVGGAGGVVDGGFVGCWAAASGAGCGADGGDLRQVRA